MNHRERVYAYVTGPRGLLILEHPQHPEAGLQVPGGTMEGGENPEHAVLREVREETGLTGIKIISCLGNTSFDMREYGHNEIQHAWYFHLECTQTSSDSWHFYETHVDGEPILFRLYWSALPYKGDELIAVQGYMLPSLNTEMGNTHLTHNQFPEHPVQINTHHGTR